MVDYSGFSGYDNNGSTLTADDLMFGANGSGMSGGGAQAPMNLFGSQPNSLFGPQNQGVGGINGMPGGMGAGGTGFGFNTQTGMLGVSALGTLGNLWMAMNAQDLAKQEFSFQKGLSTTNLDNSVKSYNTNLDDRISSRAVAENLSPDQVSSYLKNNKLNTGSIG